MKRLALVAAALLWGCPPSGPTPPPDAGAAPAKGGLRVRLPEGWSARPTAAGLDVVVDGRVVAFLEPRQGALPTLEALATAVEGEGGKNLTKESDDDFVGLLYELSDEGGSVPAFLGLKRVGPRAVHCASAPRATPFEVKAGFALCRTLTWDVAAR